MSRRAFAHGFGRDRRSRSAQGRACRGRRFENKRTGGGQSFPPAAVEFFEARVRPILVDQCMKCHGPKKQSSGLRLDSREAVLKGGDSGPAVVPAQARREPAHPGRRPYARRIENAASGQAPRRRRRDLAAMGRAGCTLVGGTRPGRLAAAETRARPRAAAATGRFSRSGRRLRRRSRTGTGCARPSTPSSWPGSRPPA